MASHAEGLLRPRLACLLNDLFHFNWGWGGSSNGWFVVDEIDYNSGADAIFNYVPAEVFDNTPKPVTNFTAIPNGDDAFTATLSWVNPTLTLNGDVIDTLSQVIIMRDETIVKVFEKYGFIWGGRWYHYDTMHFEYRPEFL